MRAWTVVVAAFAATLAAGPVRTAAAQTRTVSGVVLDSASGIGVSGAEVGLGGGPALAVSDESGAFRFVATVRGRESLTIRRLGFAPRTVALPADEGTRLQVVLAVTAVALTPVTIRAERTRYSGRLAGYYERLARRTQGQFLSRVDLEREQPTQLTDVLQRTPGIRVTRGRPGAQSIRMRGRECRPVVWLDGAPMNAGDVDLDSFSPQSLEGVEMYLGSTTVPPRFQMARGQSDCGTILLWSRGPDTEPPQRARSVTPQELEALIGSLDVYAAEDVDERAATQAGEPWQVPYPPTMEASGVSGSVTAEFVVDTSGQVEAANFGIVSSTHPLFSAAVRDAARLVSFRPAVRRGRPVRQLVRQTFLFRPADSSR